MNATVTKIVRTNKNNFPKTHMTISNVVNDPAGGKVFGFAITDDKEEVYIPSNVILNHNLSEDDIGAGFTAAMTDNPRYTAESQSPRYIVRNPLEWDGEEVVQITQHQSDEPPSTIDIEKEFGELATSSDDFAADVADLAVKAARRIESLDTKDGLKLIKEIVDKAVAHRRHIDEVAPSDAPA